MDYTIIKKGSIRKARNRQRLISITSKIVIIPYELITKHTEKNIEYSYNNEGYLCLRFCGTITENSYAIVGSREKNMVHLPLVLQNGIIKKGKYSYKEVDGWLVTKAVVNLTVSK